MAAPAVDLNPTTTVSITLPECFANFSFDNTTLPDVHVSEPASVDTSPDHESSMSDSQNDDNSLVFTPEQQAWIENLIRKRTPLPPTSSFRIGAATTAAKAGLEDSTMLGRWNSDAFLSYICTPREQLAHISPMLAIS